MHFKEANIALLVGIGAILVAILIAGGDASDGTRQLIYIGGFLLIMVTLVVLAERADRRSSDR